MDRAPGDAQRVGTLALALAAAREPREVHQALLGFVRETTSMNALFIASYDAITRLRTCRFAFSDGAEQDVAALPPMELNENHASVAIRESRTLLVRDLSAILCRVERHDVGLDIDPRLPQVGIVVPMIAHESTLGYLEIQSCEPDAFGARDVVMLETAARLAALATENLALQERERARLANVEQRLASQAVARGLVRRMLASLARRSQLPAQALRDLGRELGRGVDAKELRDFLAAYGVMGLGEITGTSREELRFHFAGRDLLELTPGASRPTCYLTLGFLEGAVEALTGERALGTELECQSQDHTACRFVVAARARA